MSRGQRALLVAIVLAAAALRFWAVDFILPNVDGRPDEREMLAYTRGFPGGDLNPRWFVYPNLFMYLAWLWISGVLAVRGVIVPTPGYADALDSALPLVLWSGRLLSAFAGTLTVLGVFVAGAHGGRPARGVIAAGWLGACWLHVRDSHFLKTEALLAGAVLVAVVTIARWAERGRRFDALLAGAAIGVAMGIKYPAVFLVVPAWIADRLRPGRGPGWPRPSWGLVLLGIASAAVFVVVCPYLLLDIGRTRDTATFLGLALYAGRPDAAAGVPAGPIEWLASRAFVYHLTHSMRYGAGLLATLALPFAAWWACRRREPLLVVAVAYCVVAYLVAGASPVRLARYVTPLMPLVALLLAEGVVAVASRVATGRLRAVVMAVLTLTLAAEPLWASVQGTRLMGREDTRVMATAWMREHLPHGARVAVLGTVLLPQGAPVLPEGVARARAPGSLADLGTPEAATHVVMHDHPLLFSTVDPKVVAALAPGLRLLIDLSPFPNGPAGGYEPEDAYYVPFYGFTGVTRPGPRIRIFEVVARRGS